MGRSTGSDYEHVDEVLSFVLPQWRLRVALQAPSSRSGCSVPIHGRMECIASQPRPSRCVVSQMATLGMMIATLVVAAQGASAVENTCRAKNLTQGTPSRS